jgi:hypothetical protein
MKKVIECQGDLSKFLEDYRYQPKLTESLDALDQQPFEQTLIDKIVLWKVNRYAPLSLASLEALNGLADLEPGSHRSAHDALAALLQEQGVDLPMASTLLRFRNPKTFQIIDRHAYRAVYGGDYPLSSGSNEEAKIELYFCYLDDLIALGRAKNLDFRTLDRVLYVFDKQNNGKL